MTNTEGHPTRRPECSASSLCRRGFARNANPAILGDAAGTRWSVWLTISTLMNAGFAFIAGTRSRASRQPHEGTFGDRALQYADPIHRERALPLSANVLINGRPFWFFVVCVQNVPRQKFTRLISSSGRGIVRSRSCRWQSNFHFRRRSR
jgi:hypothetical protein